MMTVGESEKVNYRQFNSVMTNGQKMETTVEEGHTSALIICILVCY